MTRAKALASAVIVLVLAAQLYVLLPGTPGKWYWPFVNYPMYAAAHHAGEGFTFRELDAVPCAADAPARRLDDHALGIGIFRLRNALETATGGRPDAPRDAAEVADSRRFLTTLARGVPGGPYCRLEVRGRTYAIGRAGLVDADPPPRLLAAWATGAAPDLVRR